MRHEGSLSERSVLVRSEGIYPSKEKKRYVQEIRGDTRFAGQCMFPIFQVYRPAENKTKIYNAERVLLTKQS